MFQVEFVARAVGIDLRGNFNQPASQRHRCVKVEWVGWARRTFLYENRFVRGQLLFFSVVVLDVGVLIELWLVEFVHQMFLCRKSCCTTLSNCTGVSSTYAFNSLIRTVNRNRERTNLIWVSAISLSPVVVHVHVGGCWSANVFDEMTYANWFCLLLAATSQVVDAANILAVFPSDYKSHFTLGRVLFSELANRGHQVTGIFLTIIMCER